MEFTISSFILANSIIIVASILQMVTGISVGMLIVPFLAMISYTLIPAPIVLASLVLTTLMAYKGKDHIDTKNLPQIGIGMLLGIFVSIALLINIHFEYLGVLYGVFILISVVISIKIKSFKLNKTINYVGGFISGVMGATALSGGHVLALLFQNHKLESIKATLSFVYTIFSIVLLIVFYINGKFQYLDMVLGIYMMPGFLIGYLLSPYFVKYFNKQYTKVVVLIMASIAAIVLIIKAIL
jgi:uncharacterized membrane protein YfcA